MTSATPTDAQFRILVETIEDYAIFMLDPHGFIVSWNEGARLLKGYEADEIIGKHFSTFYTPQDAKSGKCEWELEVATREGRIENIGWRVRKDGSRFWANVLITALRDDEDNLIGFAKVTRDLKEHGYRAFVEATNNIVWTTDGIGHPNADSISWRTFTGQSEEDWRSSRGWTPVHEDDRPRLAVAWSKAKEDRTPFDAEFRMRRKDGAWLWMATRAVPFLDDDGSVREWFGVTYDISARKRAELERAEALDRERAARFEAEQTQAIWTTTLASIGDAVIATDVTGRITFMNAVAENLTRWSAADAIGKALPEVFPIVNEDTRQFVENPVEKVLREGAIVGLANHTVLVRRDGTDIPIDDSAAPIQDARGTVFGVVMVFRDVSSEKRNAALRLFLLRAGEALITSADYRDSLSTIVHLAVPRLADWCAVDILEPDAKSTVQLAIAHVDPTKINMARDLARKYPPDPNAATGVPNVIRTGVSEIHRVIPQESLEAAAVDEEHLRMIRRLRLRSAMVVPLRGRDRVLGALTFVFAESGREYTDEDLVFAEELARRAGVVIERRKLEEERTMLLERERFARQQAEIANRAKDEFLAIVSHELRNPLSSILGWAKILLKQDLPSETHKSVATIERNARAQARLIEDMLDVSRIISGKLRLDLAVVNLDRAIADAVEAARRLAEKKNIEIVVRTVRGLELYADPVRLQQVITNLLTNAVKFTPHDGRIELSAERVHHALRIVVTDNGEGIDEALLSIIFEPFRQEDASTTRRHGGLGLGLAIVRQLVTAHGGTVRAESAGKGKGATFTVELPISIVDHDVDSSPSDESLPELNGTRVLIVDDNDDASDLMRAILEMAGANVVVAQSAIDALARLGATRPEVIVSDISMPDVDGYELIRRVRALPASEGGGTPAIALTAYVRPEDATRALAVGFQKHVSKPVDPKEIVTAVANLVGRPLTK